MSTTFPLLTVFSHTNGSELPPATTLNISRHILAIVTIMGISVLTTKTVKLLRFDDPVKDPYSPKLNNNQKFLCPPTSHQSAEPEGGQNLVGLSLLSPPEREQKPTCRHLRLGMMKVTVLNVLWIFSWAQEAIKTKYSQTAGKQYSFHNFL